VTRVLFVSAEPVGKAMAGPAIRVVELARAVAEHCEVAVAAPGPSDADAVAGELIEAGLSDFGVLLEAVRRHDVVVAQRLPPQLLRYVARMPVRFVADLYNPQMIEVLEAMDGGGASSQRRAWRSMLGQCAVADLVVCASEKQRDLWLGGLGLAGLLDPERYRADPTFRSFVDVVPFGLPDRPARPSSKPVLKGVWPGIGQDDRVLIWAGGVWRWLDAVTPIRAVERLRADGRAVHLVFLGTGRPASDPGDLPTSAGAAIAFARERGLEGECVHFNRGWVAYGEREAYLTEADIGVCAHPDHLEARFSFRTRVLDHFWAGLPSVVSAGDSIGDLVERRGLGRAVEPGNDECFASALAELLYDPDSYDATARRVRELAPSLAWSACARPLVRFCLEHEGRPRRRPARGALARATYGQYPDVLAALREHGGLGEAARSLPRHVGRLLRHRA
jgi:glycosyltransferase involved in cell wall biosynthesis